MNGGRSQAAYCATDWIPNLLYQPARGHCALCGQQATGPGNMQAAPSSPRCGFCSTCGGLAPSSGRACDVEQHASRTLSPRRRISCAPPARWGHDSRGLDWAMLAVVSEVLSALESHVRIQLGTSWPLIFLFKRMGSRGEQNWHCRSRARPAVRVPLNSSEWRRNGTRLLR